LLPPKCGLQAEILVEPVADLDQISRTNNGTAGDVRQKVQQAKAIDAPTYAAIAGSVEALPE
jgi:hypothetical protein